MSKIVSACESLDFELELSAIKEKDDARHPPKTRELWTGGVMRDDIPNKEYVVWLENRRDHWIAVATEMRIQNKRILKDVGQIILNQSTVHAPCDTKHLARCSPQEEQEIGREQVLDEIRALIEKWR